MIFKANEVLPNWAIMEWKKKRAMSLNNDLSWQGYRTVEIQDLVNKELKDLTFTLPI